MIESTVGDLGAPKAQQVKIFQTFQLNQALAGDFRRKKIQRAQLG
jgi:hypothetical protein